MKFLIWLLSLIRAVGAGMFFIGIGWSIRSFSDPSYDLGGAVMGGLFGLALAFGMHKLVSKFAPTGQKS